MIKLYMMDGSDEGQSFDLKTDIVYVGRSPENHIQMKDKFIETDNNGQQRGLPASPVVHSIQKRFLQESSNKRPCPLPF